MCATLVLLAAAGCSAPPPLGAGKGAIEITPLQSFGTLHAKLLLWLAGVNGIGVENRVDCYRIVYPSTDDGGKPIQLSGLLALPHGVKPRGLVSFQHGTTSDREIVPSNLSTDGLAAAIVFGANGFATLAPDYVGQGVSKLPHPYYVANDSARAVVDMIHAVRKLEGVPQTPPFLIGFSEGGYASLAAERALEAKGEKVLATASVGGAFNLRTISLPFTLKGASPQAPVYLALWVRGYATRYHHPLVSVLAPNYAATLPELFDTPHSVDEILAALPRNPRALFRSEILADMDSNGSDWLLDAMGENEMGDWRAKAPIRLFYGSRDADVPPAEATTTAQQMSARGSDIAAISVGPSDHNASILLAAPLILAWLASMSR